MCFIYVSNIFLKTWIRDNTVDIHFRKIWLIFIKNTYGSFLYFPKTSSTFWLYQRQGSKTNFRLKLKCFLMFKSSLKNFIKDNMVWPILSFQGSYRNIHLMLMYLLVSKIYWRIVSGTLWFDPYSPLQGFYQVFLKGSSIFSVWKVFEP